MWNRSSGETVAAGALALGSILAVAAGAAVLAGCGEHHVTVRYEEQPAYVEPAPTEVVIATQEPPPLPAEAIPGPPSHRHIWVPGHYGLPPHGRTVWEKDRWEKTDHGWWHDEGRWK